MQAVILAAGKSKRFYPLCDYYNKTMISLIGKPILRWTIEAVVKAGIKEIILVVNNIEMVKGVLGDLGSLRVKIQYVLQPEAVGMADGLLRAKDLIKGDFILANGSHLDADHFLPGMIKKKKDSDGVLLAEKRENPWEFGVLEVNGAWVKGIVEKPQKGQEKGNLCDVGIYLFSSDFLSYLQKFEPSHYQLEAALNKYCQEKKVAIEIADGPSVSLKYPWDLLKLKNYLLEKLPARRGKNVKIHQGGRLNGKVILEDGVEIFSNAVINGPAYLGRNVKVGNGSLIRDGSVIEENCSIGAFSDVKNSVFLPGTSLGSGFVASSIIGENCRLAHNFTTANKRFDRQIIRVKVGEKEVATGLNDLGVIMGQNVNCGINVGTMPGKTIGSGATVGPGTVAMEDISVNKKYFKK